jgi:hypothetical protein
MASAHSLQGLMKWLDRDEWRGEFEAVLDRHFLPTCEKAGIEVEEAISILDRNQFMMTVWGCAFEDFLTREIDDGRNVIDEYLKRRGWKESASTRSYMSALRTSVISLYEVSNVIRDRSFLVRDLVRGGDPILVSERSATRSLKQWDRIAARVLRVGAQTIIAGGVLSFERDASEELLKVLHNTAKRALKERHKLAALVGCEADDPRVTEALSETEMLRLAAPAFTTVWLNDILERLSNPQIPEVQNTDGDALMFCAVHFPLVEGATENDIRSVLGRLPELKQESATFWNWIATGKPGNGGRVMKVPKQQRASQTFITTLHDGSLVLGNVELKERSLVLSANSEARAAKGRALLSENLGGLVGQPLVEMQTMQQLMASQDSRPLTPPLDLSPDDQQAIIHAALDKHYREVLDEPIPMLGNVSPRSAAKTLNGRAKVVAWLKTLENHSARLSDRKDAMATYNVTWLWMELGISDLRR